MKARYAALLSIGILTFGQCSSKGKDDPRPAISIAANTATVDIDGNAFVADISASSVTLSTRSGEIIVTLNASNGSRVVVRLVEFRKSTGRFVVTDASSSSGPYYTEVANGRSVYFDPRNCSTNNRIVEITSFNESQRMISGTFSGTVCGSGTNARSVQVTNGKFNLPYTVVP